MAGDQNDWCRGSVNGSRGSTSARIVVAPVCSLAGTVAFALVGATLALPDTSVQTIGCEGGDCQILWFLGAIAGAIVGFVVGLVVGVMGARRGSRRGMWVLIRVAGSAAVALLLVLLAEQDRIRTLT
jgi:hypothetical protein